MDFIHLTHGVSIDMAGSHYTTGLQEIGSMVTVRLNLIVDHVLSRSNVNPNSIEVIVDGATSRHDYAEETNTVHVRDPGTALSTVDINYCLRCVGVGCSGDT
jgi:archaellum component FlaG (FlaF/FlaG flagellin family)